jgi:putative transposase
MTNHVHLVVVPQALDALAAALKQTHGRYASFWNAAHKSSGHVWQGRFYSCPLDNDHLWIALRYAELNPVRAGLVAQPESWPWSSAGMHCGVVQADPRLAMEAWSKRWSAASWRAYLANGETEAELKAMRRCTHTGRPLGDAQFLREMEQVTRRTLSRQRGGRPYGRDVNQAQEVLAFEESS